MHNEIIFFDTLPSTNDKAKELAREGAPEGTIILALSQENGRGRNGRVFCSQNGGLYMSLILRPDLPVTSGVSVTVGAAAAVRKAIIDVFGINVGIKWVNDLYYREKKVCGILAEGFDITATETETPRFGFIVLGIGINVSEKLKFSEELSEIAGTLEQHFNDDNELKKTLFDFALVIQREILKEIRTMEKNCRSGGDLFTREFVDNYNENFIAWNKEVLMGEKKVFAKGIDGKGGLIIVLPDGNEETITSGEVSLRPFKSFTKINDCDKIDIIT